MSISAVTSSLYGINGIRSEVLTNEEIVEEAADHNVLNNGIVGKLPPCEGANVTRVIDPSLSPLLPHLFDQVDCLHTSSRIAKGNHGIPVVAP